MIPCAHLGMHTKIFIVFAGLLYAVYDELLMKLCLTLWFPHMVTTIVKYSI